MIKKNVSNCFQVSGLQAHLKEQTDRCDSLSEQLNTAKTRLQELESQSEEKDNNISSLTKELQRLRQKVQVLPVPLFLWVHLKSLKLRPRFRSLASFLAS